MLATVTPNGSLRIICDRSHMFKIDVSSGHRISTVVPHACRPYAVRVRLKSAWGQARPAAAYIAQYMRGRLARGPLTWDLELQFFVDEPTTPIEDASKVWPEDATPIVTVARLTSTQAMGEGAAKEIDP